MSDSLKNMYFLMSYKVHCTYNTTIQVVDPRFVFLLANDKTCSLFSPFDHDGPIGIRAKQLK